jgi:hypothetical protein
VSSALIANVIRVDLLFASAVVMKGLSWGVLLYQTSAHKPICASSCDPTMKLLTESSIGSRGPRNDCHACSRACHVGIRVIMGVRVTIS